MRHNTLYGVLQRGWCITAFGRTPVYASEYIPRMVQNRTGFEVAKEEEAEKMTGRREREEGRMLERGKGVGGRRTSRGLESPRLLRNVLDTVGETKDGNREPT